MKPRQRAIETLLFGKPDRIPLQPGGGRKSTLQNWHRQGLPENVANYNEYAYRQAGGKLPWPAASSSFPVNERMIPQFEEKIIETREDSLIVQDWKGNICEIGKEFGVEHLRSAIDFVTRRWIKCPVESRQDWENMKNRYHADDPSRLPSGAAELAGHLRDRDTFLEIHFSGPFWQLREWLGFEQLCVLFHDDPRLIRDMIQFWENHIAILLERVFEIVIPDSVHLSEDMAYKSFSMISPAMAREFLLPTWKRWGNIIRQAGAPIYAMDSDGFIGELIPLWIEAGINICDPIEVAAGNDIAALRRQFGNKMAFRGGVDKRAMARGGAEIEAEIRRLEPVIQSGGFLPGCDHGVPSDVSWDNYIQYVQLLARATGWL
ncbi:MAG: uroporphyrinogen decarboxylase family protein [Verrucomicrobiae bacterium]|nr:uroporphyrinogen decarboxylase family protein [Verrucomicrobiae bacterium]